MDKPQPKAELIIKPDTELSRLFIYVASPDAAAWVEQEAPQFGKLFEPNDNERYYLLFVTPLYDVAEVEAYLNSYTD